MITQKEIQGKLPPQAIDFEKSILGSLLLYKDSILEIIDILQPESFYTDAHKIIFKAISLLFRNQQPIDSLIVIEKLRNLGDLEKIGGAYYISQLTNNPASSTNLLFYSRILEQKRIGREIISITSQSLNDAYDETIDVFDCLELLQKKSYDIDGFEKQKNKQSNIEIVEEITNEIIFAKTQKGITGLKTGLHEVDFLFRGYQNSDFIIKAGRPAMGKTSQALCEFYNITIKEKKKGIFFSLEMSTKQLMKRLISISSGISLSRINKGELTDEDWENYNKCSLELINDNLVIIDDIYSLSKIISTSKKINLKDKIDVIYVDYLQLIIHKVGNGRNKENEVSEISRSLKILAKNLNIPVICLSQLSRAVETRGGSKIPQLSDLRDSGSIEQDADIVQFLYRPEYYGITEEEDGGPTNGVALLIVAKHRNGSLKNIKLRFIDYLTKFDNWQDEKIESEYDPNSHIEPNNNFEEDIPF